MERVAVSPSASMPAAANRAATRSCSSSAASRLNASSRIRSAGDEPARTAYAARATITDVLPEPAAASTWTRLSKLTTARACSSVSGWDSIESRKSLRSRSELARIRPLTSPTGERRSPASKSRAAR